MKTSSHEFVTVDMRGLKAALVVRSQEKQLSVSMLVRSAVARDLGLAEPDHRHPADAVAARTSKLSRVKLSIRMSHDDAKQLAACAQAAGLSRDAFLAGLVAEVPVLSGGGSRKEHVTALIASSAELSTFSRNIRHLSALLRQADAEAARLYRSMLDSLAGEIRGHLELAARTLADLQPRANDRSSSASAPRRHQGGEHAPRP